MQSVVVSIIWCGHKGSSDKDICRSNDPFVLAIDRTFDQPIIKIAHFVADYHFHSHGTDTKDSDGDTSCVEPVILG